MGWATAGRRPLTSWAPTERPAGRGFVAIEPPLENLPGGVRARARPSRGGSKTAIAIAGRREHRAGHPGHAGRYRCGERGDGSSERSPLGLSVVAAAAGSDPRSLHGSGAGGAAWHLYRPRVQRTRSPPLWASVGVGLGGGT